MSSPKLVALTLFAIFAVVFVPVKLFAVDDSATAHGNRVQNTQQPAANDEESKEYSKLISEVKDELRKLMDELEKINRKLEERKKRAEAKRVLREKEKEIRDGQNSQ